MIPLLLTAALAAKPAGPSRACTEQLDRSAAALTAEADAAWEAATATDHPDVVCAGAMRFLDEWSAVSVHCEDKRGLHVRDVAVERLDEARATLDRLGGCWDLESPAFSALILSGNFSAKECFRPLYASEQGLPERIDLLITISEAGPATGRVVQEGYDTLGGCLTDAMAEVTLPESARGTRIVYPFILQ